MVPGETGLLVPPESVDALAGAIVELGADVDRAPDARSPREAPRNDVFGEEQSVAAIEAIYRAALVR